MLTDFQNYLTARLASKFITVIIEHPITLNAQLHTTLWFNINHNSLHVSVTSLFSDPNISQSSVAKHLSKMWWDIY